MKQDSEYWDGIAPQWTQEIFNSLRNDRNRVIRRELERAARSAENIVDYGCGIGNYLPALARLFESVHGFDHSSACVEIARKRMQRKKAVVDAHIAAATEDRGVAVLITGNGKGKSRSGFGMVMRTLGTGCKPAVGRFLKGAM